MQSSHLVSFHTHTPSKRVPVRGLTAYSKVYTTIRTRHNIMIAQRDAEMRARVLRGNMYYVVAARISQSDSLHIVAVSYFTMMKTLLHLSNAADECFRSFFTRRWFAQSSNPAVLATVMTPQFEMEKETPHSAWPCNVWVGARLAALRFLLVVALLRRPRYMFHSMPRQIRLPSWLSHIVVGQPVDVASPWKPTSATMRTLSIVLSVMQDRERCV